MEGDRLFWLILLQLVLIGINAFFAASEMALVSINANLLRKQAEDGDKKAKQLLRLSEEPTAFLSAAVLAYAVTGILMEPELPLETQFLSAIAAMEQQFRSKYPETAQIAATLKAAVRRAEAAEPMSQVMEELQCYSAMNCLAGAIYASLANQNDFDTAMITAVNHSGYSSAVGAITGEIKSPFTIDQDKCIKCGACIDSCKFNAIYKK